jgi:regulator-associated protein of mTOR
MTMTAVAIQQNGSHSHQYNPRHSSHSSTATSSHQSRPQSYVPAAAGQILRQEAALQNGTSAVMNPRPAVSNDPVPSLNGNSSSDQDQRPSAATGRSTIGSNVIAHDRRFSIQDRPTSAPGTNGESSQDDSDIPRRRPKPLLKRAKSDFGPRGEDPDSQTDEDIQDWGARHGFEDHYASEEYVSQLANVSCSFLMS